MAGQCVVIAAAGLAAFVAPTLLGGVKQMESPLFPWIRTAVEGMSWMAIALVAGVCLVAGASTRLRHEMIGLSSVACLPIASFAEIVADPSSHNLIPFELVVYGTIGVMMMLPAWLGRRGMRMAGLRNFEEA